MIFAPWRTAEPCPAQPGLDQPLVRQYPLSPVNHRKTASDKNSPLKLTDLGCGGGDVALAIGQALRKREFRFPSPASTEMNIRLPSQGRYALPAGIRFEKSRYPRSGFSLDACDILFSEICHFRGRSIGFIRLENRAAVSTAFICNELEQTPLRFACSGGSLFCFPSAGWPGRRATRHPAFLHQKEWIALFEKAGIAHYRIRRVPCSVCK